MNAAETQPAPGIPGQEDNLDFMTARLLDIRPETRDVSTYQFTLEGNRSFHYLPGQFNMIGLPGLEEAPISFSSLAEENSNRFVHTIRHVGNITNRVSRLQKNDSVLIRGPFGTAWPLEKMNGKDILLIAGGIGLAPVRPLVLYWLERPEQRGKLTFVYGAKLASDMVFQEELVAWQGHNQIDTMYYVDYLTPSVESRLQVRQGLVTEALRYLDLDYARTLTCICGPEIMMRFVARSLIRLGCPAEAIFVSMERNMRCGIAQCGHCQIGSKFVCQDGPVFSYPDIARFVDTLL